MTHWKREVTYIAFLLMVGVGFSIVVTDLAIHHPQASSWWLFVILIGAVAIMIAGAEILGRVLGR